MNAAVVIPARMASTRFPGKPLADICGKPMIQWVYERALRAKGISAVVVATCDTEIAEAVRRFGGEVVMTSDRCRSGTDRVAEAAACVGAEIIVNVQGDEPFIEPSFIEKSIEPLLVGEDTMTSLMFRITEPQAQDPNLVKVVVSLDGHALYFSRAPIPYVREKMSTALYGHIGLYAYTRDFLLRFASWEPTPLELTESLEQLRVLEHGGRIRMVEVDGQPLGVDTPSDLEQARKHAAKFCT
ncbi:MAG: 3-deoxy-manno-octulosonate cytidylyltransferase [Armatimonadota bacterium]|nr:3-deoxy-manno-octulosonate cytidylyltransferase [Armatimonadota bacterium]